MSMVRGSVGFELLRVFALLDSYAGIQALIAAISCNVSCVCVCVCVIRYLCLMNPPVVMMHTAKVVILFMTLLVATCTCTL